MPILYVTPEEAARFVYVHRPDFINEPGQPVFLWVNRGTDRQLLINLALFLDEETAKIDSEATEGGGTVEDGAEAFFLG